MEYTSIPGGTHVKFHTSLTEGDKLVNFVSFSVVMINMTKMSETVFGSYVGQFKLYSVRSSWTKYLLSDLQRNFGISDSFGPSNTFEPNCIIGYNFVSTAGILSSY